jgi:predicted transcriptional regulator
MMLAMPKFTIELDDDLAARLEAATAQSQTSVETFAANAVARAVADVEAWTEDEAAYAEYERTGEAIPLEAMEDWVRSWGTANELPPPAPCKSSS